MRNNKVKLDAGIGENSICPLSALMKRTNLDVNRIKQQNSQPTGRNLKGTEKIEKDCTCCMCVDVSSSVMFSEKTNTSYNTATAEDCSCNSCSCSETSTNKTVESVNKCTCAKCVCPVCPGKRTQPSNQPAAAQVGDTAANTLTNKSCNCEKCVCSVCPFRATDMNAAKSSQTNKQTIDQGTGEGFKCDCSISTDRSKTKIESSTQGTNCTCLLNSKEEKQTGDCKCNMCPDRTQIQPGLIKESLNCECTECKCNPCADPGKGKGLGAANTESSGDCQCPDLTNIPGDIFKGPTTCFCSVCRCSPCGDQTKMGVKGNITKGVDSSNGKDCECNPCSDPSKLTADLFKKPMACNCNQCVCNPCADVEKRTQMENQKQGKEQGLDINKTEKETTDIGFQEYQRIPCNCSKCTCILCNDPKLNKGKEDSNEPNVQQGKQGQTTADNCECTICACDSSNKSPPSSIPCNCPVCHCDPCKDPNINKAKGDVVSKQPAVCHCPTCNCDPCVDPNAKRNTEKKSKVDKPFDEETCLCNPCVCDSNKKGLTESKLPCDCPVCSCQPCSDPNMKGGVKPAEPLGDNNGPRSDCICQKCVCDGAKVTKIDDKTDENKNTSQQNGDSKSNCKCSKCLCRDCTADTPAEAIKCHCERCTCKECERKTTVDASEIQNSPTLDFTCHCSPCKCNQCLDRKQEKQQQQKDAKTTKEVKSDIQKEICICTTCDCPDTKTDDKAVTCACVECACPACPYGDGKRQLGNAICRCAPCTCVDCSTKSEKTGEEAKKLDTDSNKNVCLCSPCNCVGCMFAEKNVQRKTDKKGDSQVLEFKCTCLELPMGRSKAPTEAKPDIDKFINPPRSECRAKSNCMSYGCRILTNNNFQKFEIPIRLHSPSKNKYNHFELESLFKSIPERLTGKKKKKKHKTTERDQSRHRNLPPHSELLLPQAKIAPTEYVGCMSEQIKNFINKSHEKHYYEVNPGDYASKSDKYRENIKVIKDSLKKIKNKKKNSKEYKPFIKIPSDFAETMSELGIAFDYLKKNCKPDDEVIKAITKEIKRYTSSTTFISLFSKSEKQNKPFVPEKNDVKQRSYNHPTRTSVPTIPVLQPTMVSVRPASAAPGQHRPGQVCHCSICTGPSPDLMYYSGDTRVKHKQSKLVRTINYERSTSFVSNSSRQFSTKDSECYLMPQSDRSLTRITNFYPTASRPQIRDSDTAACDIYQGGCKYSSDMMNPLLVKQASSFGLSTLSGLKVAVTTLEAKCRAKDKIIEETTHKLKQHLSSSVLVSFMNRLEGIPRYIDADETKKSIRNAETQIERSVNDKKIVPCKCGRIHKDNKHVSLSGFMVVNIKRITVDSIIIEWKAPKSKSVTGYEIEINGQHKSRVMSGWRTCAMVHSVVMSAALNISIYAVTPYGRCYPPARAIYEIKHKKNK